MALRGTDLLDRKLAVIQTLIAHNLPSTLVCTLVKNVNEDQVGPLLELGLATPQIRGLTLQPATFSGRYERDLDPLQRLTLGDCVHLVVEQSGGLFRDKDWKPLPCSNPNCCYFTFAVRRPNRAARPLTRVINYEEHLQRLADRMNFNLQDARAVGGGACAGKTSSAWSSSRSWMFTRTTRSALMSAACTSFSRVACPCRFVSSIPSGAAGRRPTRWPASRVRPCIS